MIRAALAALAAAIAAAAGAAGAGPAPEPLLGFAFAPRSTTLVRLDPSTLSPLAGSPRLETRGHLYGWSFSPDRSRLVVGDTRGELLIVDPVRFTVLATVASGVKETPAATVWFGKRLFAVFHTALVREIDVDRGEAAGSVRVGAALYGVARSRAGIVLLVGPAHGIGPVKLAVVDARLRVRSVRLERITAGLKVDRTSHVFEQRRPGLAVDEATGRAFVVAGSAPVAVVSLRSLTVAYRRPALAATVDAAQKGANGPRRTARWLGGGRLAVSGVDEHSTFDGRGRLQTRTDPAGATVVDTSAWTATTIDAMATSVTPAANGLLTSGMAWTSGQAHGSGLRLHGTEGERFHLFGDEALFLVRVAGARAIVGRAGRSGYDLVDLDAGVVVTHLDGNAAMPLTGSFQEYIG